MFDLHFYPSGRAQCGGASLVLQAVGIINDGTSAADFGQDFLGHGLPVVAFRLIVVMFDVLENGLLELADAGERAAVQTLLGQIEPCSTKFSQELLVGVKCM